MTEPIKIDWFIGTVFRGEAEITGDMFSVLVDHAETYLRSCGSIGWAEWQCLSTRSQGAFQEAGRRIDDVKTEKLAELVALRLLAALCQSQEAPV